MGKKKSEMLAASEELQAKEREMYSSIKGSLYLPKTPL